MPMASLLRVIEDEGNCKTITKVIDLAYVRWLNYIKLSIRFSTLMPMTFDKALQLHAINNIETQQLKAISSRSPIYSLDRCWP